jgi:hypothetical protein
MYTHDRADSPQDVLNPFAVVSLRKQATHTDRPCLVREGKNFVIL